MRLIANISVLFTEWPMSDRFALARDAGFDGVEIQFPDADQIDRLRDASARTGMAIELINVPRGPGDAVGLAALPEARMAFREAVKECYANAVGLDVRKVNILSGRVGAQDNPEACRHTLIENLCHAADVMAQQNVKVMLEAVNPWDVPGFFIDRAHKALDIIGAVDHPNLAMQFDLYHMARTEPDLVQAIATAGAQIGHVQFADTHGRHEPGTGDIDFAAAFTALRHAGYDGAVSAEYVPKGDTLQGLGWMQSYRGYLT